MIAVNSIGVCFTEKHAFIVCLEKKLSSIQIKAYARFDLQEFDSVAEQLESIEKAITEFIVSNELGNPPVFCSLPAAYSIVRQLTFPSSVKDDLASTIKYSLENYIPIKTEDLFFDFETLSENKEKNAVNVLLGAARKRDMMPFLDLAVRMDSGISGIQLYSVALANYSLNQPELKIASSSKAFVFYSDKKMLDIICFINGDFEYSRQIRLKDDEDDLQQIVKNELQNMEGEHATEESGVLAVLYGSGFSKQKAELFSGEAGVTLRFEGIENYELPSEDFIPAIGTALEGLSLKDSLSINLLPENKRKKVSKSASYIMAALMCAVVILGVVWGGSAYFKEGLVQKEIDLRLEQLESNVQEVYKKKDRIVELEKRIETVNRLVWEQAGLNRIINELSRIIPSTSWLKTFSFDNEKGVRVGGESETASDLIPLLEASELLENCVFLSAITKDKSGKERFLIGCDIEKKRLDKKQ